MLLYFVDLRQNLYFLRQSPFAKSRKKGIVNRNTENHYYNLLERIMQKKYVKKARTLSCFHKEYDAIICGGGVAGCAAAIACARNGLKTALVENQLLLGGLATSGLVLYYLPLCDGNGKQVIKGLSHTFLERCNEFGPAEINPNWKKGGNGNRLAAYFSPPAFVMTLDRMMEENGVDVWFDTRITGVKMAGGKGNRVSRICVDNKSGHGEISAKVFIDATGDADLVYFTGRELHQAPNSRVTWVIERREKMDSTHFTFGAGVSTLICAENLNANSVPPGVNGKLVSGYMMETRRKYKELLDESAKNGEDRKSRYPISLPSMAPLRHTRCIMGEYMLEEKDENASFEDSIGVLTDWRKCSNLMEVPFRALIPRDLSNVLAAGRTVSAKEDAWEITRVIPCAAMTGEAAGEAANLFIRKKCRSFREMDVKKLQKVLREKYDFPIHYDEIK